MSLAIQVGSGYLDLGESARNSFYINKQVFDLTNLEDRKATSSRSLNIPFTDNNFRLLALEIPGFSPNQRGVNLIDCQVTLQGVPIFNNAKLKVEVTQSRREIGISIVDGVSRFFRQIPEAPLSQLSFQGEEEDFTIANLLTKTNTTSGFLFGRANWLTQPSGINVRNADNSNLFQLQTHVDVQQSGFFYYARQIFEKIVNQTQFTVDYSELDSLFDEVVIALPLKKFFNGYQVNQTAGYNGIASASGFTVTANNATPQLIPLVASQQSNIVYSSNQFVVQAGFAGRAFITLNYKGNIKGLIKNSSLINHRVRIRQNGVTTAERQLPVFGVNASWEFKIAITNYLQVGDTIDFVVIFDASQAPNPSDIQLNFLDAVENTEATLRITQITESERRIDLANSMPGDVTQKDFVKALFQVFGIVPVEEDGEIKLKYWNDILKRKAKQFDILTNQSFSETKQFPPYVETNIVKYDDTNVVRDDANSVLRSDVDVDGQTRILIDNKFSPIDTSTVYPFFAWHSVPAWNAEYIPQEPNSTITFNPPNSYTIGGTNPSRGGVASLAIGDLVYTSTIGIARVIAVTDTQNGFVDAVIGSSTSAAPFSVLKYTEGSYSPLHFATVVTKDATTNPWSIRDGNTVSAVSGNFKSVEFLDTLKWSNLLSNYYSVLQGSVRNPYVLQGFFNIDIDDFVTLDLLAPVFVPGIGQLFYINKMDQYKPDRPTRMTLISLQDDGS